MELIRPPTVEEAVWDKLSPVEQKWAMTHEKMHEDYLRAAK